MRLKNTLLFIVLFSAIVVASYLVLSKQTHSHHSLARQAALTIHGFILPEPKVIQAFTTTNDSGDTFTEKNLIGHWTLLFFGFTNCGFVCPTTLASLNQVLNTLHKRKISSANVPQIVMISVDPKRDTVKKLHHYVKSFNPNFIGLRAPIDKTLQLEKQFNVVSVKLASKDAPKQYTINHSAELMVINPAGKMVALLSNPEPAKRIVDDYLKIIS